MPTEQSVLLGRPEHLGARRLGHISDGKERTAAHEKMRNMWNLLVSNVTRTAPRLRSQDVEQLLAPDGRPTVVPPWDLPLDVVWGTDKPDNGRLFMMFAVEDKETAERSVINVYEQRGPTNLPIGFVRMAGTVDLVGDATLADTEDTLRGLLRLFRNGEVEFRRLTGVAGDTATLEVTAVALQIHKTGFAPSQGRPQDN